MNMMQSFNRTIDYIETVLDDQVDEKKILYLSGYSYPMFSRLFSVLTGSSLSEYIRKRRLTESAIELRNCDNKITDIAFKYGYDSLDSFGAAFKKFHGFTPSQVRYGKPFQLVSRIQLTLTMKGGRSMNVSIQKKAGFFVAGIVAKEIESSLCEEVWAKLFENYSHEELSKLGTGESVGVCYDMSNPNKINYMAGYIVSEPVKAKGMGLDILEVEETEYAVLELEGKVPDCIHNGWKYAMEVFFPEHGYRHSGKPDFEYYYEGDMDSSDYKMELWIPIVRE